MLEDSCGSSMYLVKILLFLGDLDYLATSFYREAPLCALLVGAVDHNIVVGFLVYVVM